VRRAVVGFALWIAPACATGQQVHSAVVPQDITVGDVFHAVIQVVPVLTGTVQFPDSLVLPADLEQAGRRQLRQDTVTSGPRWTAVYPVTGWRPGRHALSPVTLGLAAGGRRLAAEAVFPEVLIRSVLPSDTAGIQPKQARDVMGANRLWWPWLLLMGAIILLTAAVYLVRRRRRPAVSAAPEPAVPARTIALLALDRARASGALEAGDTKRFYSDVSAALRAYLAALDPTLGTDLTTTELAASLFRRSGGDQGAAELHRLLRAADLVKFARRRPAPGEALQEWQRARTWVESWETNSMSARAA